MSALFSRHADATHVVHLAAQAGVRYSLEQPASYVHANVMGQLGVFEAVRKLHHVEHVLYASSSSVYGANTQVPFSVEHCVSSPVSLYAATKLAGEHIAETYGHLYRIPSTGFRFFTVYGPWGRPDMAYYKFARQIVAGESIAVYNNGDMARDFTYIDDVVAGLMGALHKPPRPNDFGAPHRIYNLGNQPSGAPAGFHCRAGAGPWPPREHAFRAHAAGRRAGDVCRHLAIAGGFRLRPADDHRSRHSALRRLVQVLSQRELGFLSPSCEHAPAWRRGNYC